jgi:hypothetical protein
MSASLAFSLMELERASFIEAMRNSFQYDTDSERGKARNGQTVCPTTSFAAFFHEVIL